MKTTMTFSVLMLLAVSGCGLPHVPPELIGLWEGSSSFTTPANRYTEQMSVSVQVSDEGAGALKIVSWASKNKLVFTCRITGFVSAAGFEVEPGSVCALEGYNPQNCSVSASVTEVTAIRTGKSLSITGRGRLVESCKTYTPPDFTLTATLLKL